MLSTRLVSIGKNIPQSIFKRVIGKFIHHLIRSTGRPIVLSCEWPFYQGVFDNIKPDYSSISKYCNQYRNFYDVDDSWQRVLQIIDFYVETYDFFSEYHGVGHWNDPDMLDIG